MKLKTVMLSGAGGTGKTAVLDYVCSKLGTFPFQRMPSITREAYKIAGIDSEKAAIEQMTEEEMTAFQTAVFDTYCTRANEKVDECLSKGDEILFLERSPYDYVAYQIYVRPSMSLGEINDLIQRADEFMDTVADKANLFCWYLPYPTPWSSRATDNGNSFDDVRYAPAGKNYAWDSILRRVLRLQEGTEYIKTGPLYKFEYTTASSIEDRSATLCYALFPPVKLEDGKASR